MEEALNIQLPVEFDDSVIQYDFQAHQPYATSTFNSTDEIHITIQNQDQLFLPSKSLIHVQGRLTKSDGAAVTGISFVNNAICFLFSEIRYELGAEVVDRCKNVGITTIMKGYPSFTPNQTKGLENAGWKLDNQAITNTEGYFDVLIPLNIIIGFAEDYVRIVANLKQELILIRSNNDKNAILQIAESTNYKISINKLEWFMPHLILSDSYKLNLYKYIKNNPPIAMGFRSWDLYEYPMLPPTIKHVWSVKTTNPMEKPRYVILGFQTDRNKNKADASKFDHCQLTNVKLFLNSQEFPHGNMKLNVGENQFALLYEMFTQFQTSYYNRKNAKPLINKATFINEIPLVVIDCSKQNETIKFGPVDIRLEIETSIAFPANTTAYCLILHDKIIEYKPISGEVRKLV